MRTRPSLLLILLGLLLTAPVLSPSLGAQTASKGERRLITRVEPVYPPVLKARQIGGTVRLEVTITAKGNVEGVTVLGGNPILAESAVEAVKKWKYAAADSQSTAEVKLEFNPYR